MARRAVTAGIGRRQFLGAVAGGAVAAQTFVLSAGQQPAPRLPDHHDLSYFLTATGQRQSIRTIQDWEQRRQHILRAMQQVMGPFPGADKRVPLDVRVAGEVQLENGLVRRTLSFASESAKTEPDLAPELWRVYAHLFLPAQSNKAAANGRLPAILCLQQTSAHGADEPAGLRGATDMHYGLDLARRGYVVLAPDYPSFNQHPWNFDKDHYDSGSMKAVWDNVCAVDLLQSLPQVDPRRIGCLGHSLGGHNAMFTAAFDPRIQVIVSNSGFSSFRKDDVPSWTGPRYMPRIASEFGNAADRLPFDFPELVASFAPRPFLAIAPTRDSDFDPDGVRDCITAARPVYALYGKPEHLQADYPELGHSFPAKSRERAYAFLDTHLGQPRT